MEQISKTEFKAHALEVLRDIEQSGQPRVITNRGKPTVLPGEFHQDPADRMIVATARKLAVPLVTADEKIINDEHVKTVW